MSTLAQFARSSQNWLLRVATLLAACGRYDFCPWANPYVRWLKLPLGWFALGAFASGLVGAFVAPQAWLLCAVLIVVATLGVLWPLIALRGVTATLEFDRQRCQEGDAVAVTLEVANRWPWPAWGLVVEHGSVQEQAAGDSALVALDRIPGWSLSRFTLTWQTTRRGRYPRAAPRLATGFPFGLWSASRPATLRAPILVRPRTVGLASLPCTSGPTAAAGALVDRAGDDGSLLGARPYRPGDSLRRVHWVHTARRDVLLVCERQTAARRSVLIELDSTSLAQAGGEDVGDWACRIAASLCREFLAHGCEVACVANGDRPHFTGTTRGLGEILDRLAVLSFTSPSSAESEDAAQAKPPRSAPTALAGAAPLWIVVTTDAAYRSQSDARRTGRVSALVAKRRQRWRAGPVRRDIVLAADPRALEAPAGDDAPWMAISLSSDVERQLRQQWERSCHDDWASN
ncbi:MAG: DUF58 domain-containing protein [Pirellulales bacterium]